MLVLSTLWLGTALAAPTAEEAADLCRSGSFQSPPSADAFLTLLGAQGAERTDPTLVQAYEGCLQRRFQLSPRQARCYAIYSRPCESAQEWRAVDGSLAPVVYEEGQDSFTPQFGSEPAGPAPVTETSALPWLQAEPGAPVWTPGVDAPAGPTPDPSPATQPPALGSGAWAATAGQVGPPPAATPTPGGSTRPCWQRGPSSRPPGPALWAATNAARPGR